MLRIALAVILGYVLIGLLVVGTDQLFALAIPGFDTMVPRPAFYYAISLIASTVYSIIGGWTCAAIARTRVELAAKALIVLGELAGLAATVMLWKIAPHYYNLTLLLLYPIAVWFGAKSFVWTRPVRV